MRPLLYLCVIIMVLHGVIHCDHHQDHGQEGNHTINDHHGKDQHDKEQHGNGQHGKEDHGKEQHDKEHHGKQQHDNEDHGKEHHDKEGHGKERHDKERHDKEHHGKEDHEQKQDGEQHQHHEHPSKDIMTCHKAAAANADFAFNFYKHFTSDGKNDNVFFSPMSISTAFSMLSLGANGATHDQIIEGLAFNLTEMPAEEIHTAVHQLIHTLNDPKSELQLSTANALFIQEELKILPTFLEDVKKYYESEVFSSNFRNDEEAKKQINDYVENKTHGKIVDLLKSFEKSTLMVLINCIYFKGKWEKPFNPELTAEEDFTVDEATVVKVPMMRRYSTFNSWKDQDLACTIVQLSYAGNASAFLVLPDEGKMKQVEEGLSTATVDKWRHSVSQRIVNLYFPKFKVEATIELQDVLNKMGMTEVFADSADLSRITGQKGLKASKAVHKAVMSIDEQGTEAAGATAIEIMPVSFVFPTKFNKPFLFILWEHTTNSLLFLGKIVNPTNV